MSLRACNVSPSYQRLQNVSVGSNASTPRMRGNPSHGSGTLQEKRSSKALSPKTYAAYQNRLFDVMPLFTVEAAVRCVEVVSDRIAWTADCDGSITVRTVSKGDEVRNLGGRDRAFCTCLLFLEKQSKMWAAFSDGFIRVFDVFSYALVEEFVQHDNSVECMIELEGSVYSGGRDWKIFQWNSENCQYVRQFFGHTNTVRCLCSFIGDTGAVLFSGGDDGAVKAWNPYSLSKQFKEETACMHTFTGHTRGVLSLVLVKSKNHLWSAGEDTTIRVWDLHTLHSLTVLKNHGAPVSCLAFIECRVWSGDKHGRIILWDYKKFVPLQELSLRSHVEHRSVLAIRKMVPTVVWKVWTMGSAGQIHCWNAESHPLFLDSDTHQTFLSHLEDETLHVDKKLNTTSSCEVVNTKQGAVKGDGDRCYTDPFDEASKQEQEQPLMEGKNGKKKNSCLRQQQEKLKGTKEGEKKKMNKMIKEENVNMKETPPREITVSPGDFLSIDKSGGSHILTTALASPESLNDVHFVTEKHKREFSGSAWPEVFKDHADELHAAFVEEINQLLGSNRDKLKQTSIDIESLKFVGTAEISHTSKKSLYDIQTLFDIHPFCNVIDVYVKALEKKTAKLEEKNKDLSKILQQFHDEKEKKKSDNMMQQNEVKVLSKELDRYKRMYNKLRDDFSKLQEQTASKEELGNTAKLLEEYDALKIYLDYRIKPLISHLKRLNNEKDVDLKENEERIKRLQATVEELRSCGVNVGNNIVLESAAKDQTMPLKDYTIAEKGTCFSEIDLLALVDALLNTTKRYLAENDNSLKLSEETNESAKTVLDEKNVTLSDAKGFQMECTVLRDNLRKQLLPSFLEVVRPFFDAYLNEIKRRRAAEDDLYSVLRKFYTQRFEDPQQPLCNALVAAQKSFSASSSCSLGVLAKDLSTKLQEAIRHLNGAFEDCENIRNAVVQ